MLTPSTPPLHHSAPLSQRPPASSCQVYGSKVTMKLPACENIELQKHPWVRGCVNGAFSAEPDPGPVLLTDGQQMAFCVREETEGERKRGQRGEMGQKRDTEKVCVCRGGPSIFSRTSSIWGPICRSEMPYHMPCLTFGPHSAKAVRFLSSGEHKASKATIHPPSADLL